MKGQRDNRATTCLRRSGVSFSCRFLIVVAKGAFLRVCFDKKVATWSTGPATSGRTCTRPGTRRKTCSRRHFCYDMQRRTWPPMPRPLIKSGFSQIVLILCVFIDCMIMLKKVQA